MFGISFHSEAQSRSCVSKNEKTLTEVLQMISKKKAVYINFNPKVTNRIYIKDVSSDKNEIKSLNNLLVDYDLEIKSAGLNFLYISPIQKILIKGCLKEKGLNKRLSDIVVTLDGKYTARTDMNGNFSFSILKGNHKLTIRDKAYYPVTMSLSKINPKNILIKLDKKKVKVLPPVISDVQTEKEKMQIPLINNVVSDSSLVQKPDIPDALPNYYKSNSTYILPLPAISPMYVLKSNLVMWEQINPNIAFEYKLSENVTAEISVGLKIGNNKNNGKSISYLIQPEIRYWLSNSFNGFFIGFHMYYAQFSKNNMVYLFQRRGTSNYDREGYLYGMGASCGYQFSINKHWRIEATAGAGNIHLAYDKMTWNNSFNNKKSLDYNYFGLTKAAINLVYAF
ncbi:DUF3575 domain-containing protein [Bacteroides luti]|nr:DUF3575 domain-containing protein [Bacteroides luti]